jgi:hypothetical protein
MKKLMLLAWPRQKRERRWGPVLASATVLVPTNHHVLALRSRGVGFSPGVVLGYIRSAGLRGRNRLLFCSRDFLLDRNGCSQPID